MHTNILVYTFDAQAPQNKPRAKELLKKALLTHEGVVSAQVIRKFLNVATEENYRFP